MANELVLSAQTDGKTSGDYYCIIRRLSDGYVAINDTGAWEVWSDLNFDVYPIAMDCKYGDLWTASFPTLISAGTKVQIAYYSKAGVIPAVSDTIVQSETYIWNGSSLTSGSTVSISAYALTTLASLKRYLHITSDTDNDFLTETINAVSDRIERECGRQFAARDYTERFSGNWDSAITLKQRPVNYVSRVAYGAASAINVSSTGFVKATVFVSSTAVRLMSVNSSGTKTSTELTFASYPSFDTMATAIDAVSGWTATKIVDGYSYDLNPFTGTGCASMAAILTYPDQDTQVGYIELATGKIGLVKPSDPYTMNQYQSGVYASQKGYLNYLIEYNAGYSTIPSDLAMLCNELCSTVYSKGKLNQNLKSESLGDYSYSLASELEITSDMRDKLRRWCEIGVPA